MENKRYNSQQTFWCNQILKITAVTVLIAGQMGEETSKQ